MTSDAGARRDALKSAWIWFQTLAAAGRGLQRRPADGISQPEDNMSLFFDFFGVSPNIGVFLEFSRNNSDFGTFLEHFLFEIRLTNGQEIFLLGGEFIIMSAEADDATVERLQVITPRSV